MYLARPVLHRPDHLSVMCRYVQVPSLPTDNFQTLPIRRGSSLLSAASVSSTIGDQHSLSSTIDCGAAIEQRELKPCAVPCSGDASHVMCLSGGSMLIVVAY